MRVYGDDGAQLCSLSTQDAARGPVTCCLRGGAAKTPTPAAQHRMVFSYRIELWKAKAFGIHFKVDTITSSFWGPLVDKELRLIWVDDR